MFPQTFRGTKINRERQSKCKKLAPVSPQPLNQFPSLQSLTQAKIIIQSSAVFLLRIPNRLMSLATTKRVARMKVVVVTMNAALPRPWSSLIEDIGIVRQRASEAINVMVVAESTRPSARCCGVLNLKLRARRGGVGTVQRFDDIEFFPGVRSAVLVRCVPYVMCKIFFVC